MPDDLDGGAPTREPDDDETGGDEAGPPGPPREPGGGPRGRNQAFLEERRIALGPSRTSREAPDEPSREEEPQPRARPRSALIREFRQRQRARLSEREAEEEPPEEAGPTPTRELTTNGWTPIGPAVVRQGQGGVLPATSGRVRGIAVTPGGSRVYVASANGGVWRSDDTGRTWRSLMESFDLNPTTVASDSLACGAIAVVSGSPDRIYVGSGEGALGEYFGVGPIVSTDGGVNWRTEPVRSGDPPLAGSTFTALAIDPADAERVVAATRNGIYRREPDGAGGYHWARKTMGAAGEASSVVVARRGSVTTFFASRRGGPVFRSTDGATWALVGSGFPSTNVARVGLAVQPGNADVLYALIATTNGLLHGIYRLRIADGTWRRLTGAPPKLFGDPGNPPGQGNYDLAIAVDPNDVNRIFVGGSTAESAGEWSAALYRCSVTTTATGGSVSATFIGGSVHADVHVIQFAPGDAGRLWVGCDGGVFYSTNPTGTGNIFQARNTGLATLTMHHLGQHPSEEGVVFAGTQDNGTVRFTGEEVWLHSAPGDGGFVVVNWHDPYKVLVTYVANVIRRSGKGGPRYQYGVLSVPISTHATDPTKQESVLFYAPLAGTPPTSTPADADLVAFGSERPWLSTTFGGNWSSIPSGTLAGDRLNERIRSLAFASPSKLYAGTMRGGVYRFDRAGTSWTRTPIHSAGGSSVLPFAGPVTDIAIDRADGSGNSIYITFGGQGDFRHVWRFDGTRWEARSGPAGRPNARLMDVQANAIVVDPTRPHRLFLGADLGVWTSADAGATWLPYSEGLPDAAVIDLQILSRRRLLRASTHGRGVYERTIDERTRRKVELFTRDTRLDQGRRPSVDGLADPAVYGARVHYWLSPDIRVDVPDASGRYQIAAPATIDVHQFIDRLTDEGRRLAVRPSATAPPRAYVLVHSRGPQTANDVRLTVLLANASAGLPPLPRGYASNVRSGTPITNRDWRTLGSATVSDVRPGSPRIARFELRSGVLPPPPNRDGGPHVSLLALLHHGDDPFTSGETSVEALTTTERKVAQRSISVVQFPGTGASGAVRWIPIRIHNPSGRPGFRTTVAVEHAGFPGPVKMVLPPIGAAVPLRDAIESATVSADLAPFRAWAADHLEMIKAARGTAEAFDTAWSAQRIEDIQRVLATNQTVDGTPGAGFRIRGLTLEASQYQTMFLMVGRPTRGRVGDRFEVVIRQLDETSGRAIGGMTVGVELVAGARSVPRHEVLVALSDEQLDALQLVAADAAAGPEDVLSALADVVEEHPWVRDQTHLRLTAPGRRP